MTKDAAYTVVVACKHVEEGACIACVRNAIAAAREEGRTAGYAEAVERAAQVADRFEAKTTLELKMRPSPSDLFNNGYGCAAFMIAEEIRALAPAATNSVALCCKCLGRCDHPIDSKGHYSCVEHYPTMVGPK